MLGVAQHSLMANRLILEELLGALEIGWIGQAIVADVTVGVKMAKDGSGTGTEITTTTMIIMELISRGGIVQHAMNLSALLNYGRMNSIG